MIPSNRWFANSITRIRRFDDLIAIDSIAILYRTYMLASVRCCYKHSVRKVIALPLAVEVRTFGRTDHVGHAHLGEMAVGFNYASSCLSHDRTTRLPIVS